MGQLAAHPSGSQERRTARVVRVSTLRYRAVLPLTLVLFQTSMSATSQQGRNRNILTVGTQPADDSSELRERTERSGVPTVVTERLLLLVAPLTVQATATLSARSLA